MPCSGLPVGARPVFDRAHYCSELGTLETTSGSMAQMSFIRKYAAGKPFRSLWECLVMLHQALGYYEHPVSRSGLILMSCHVMFMEYVTF